MERGLCVLGAGDPPRSARSGRTLWGVIAVSRWGTRGKLHGTHMWLQVLPVGEGVGPRAHTSFPLLSLWPWPRPLTLNLLPQPHHWGHHPGALTAAGDPSGPAKITSLWPGASRRATAGYLSPRRPPTPGPAHRGLAGSPQGSPDMGSRLPRMPSLAAVLAGSLILFTCPSKVVSSMERVVTRPKFGGRLGPVSPPASPPVPQPLQLPQEHVVGFLVTFLHLVCLPPQECNPSRAETRSSLFPDRTQSPEGHIRRPQSPSNGLISATVCTGQNKITGQWDLHVEWNIRGG